MGEGGRVSQTRASLSYNLSHELGIPSAEIAGHLGGLHFGRCQGYLKARIIEGKVTVFNNVPLLNSFDSFLSFLRPSFLFDWSDGRLAVSGLPMGYQEIS